MMHQLLTRLLPAAPRHRHPRTITPHAIESLERRLCLSPWSGGWQYGPSPDAPPPNPPNDPGPYDMNINEGGLSTLEIPDEGNIPIKPKVKGDKLTAKGKSDNLSCKLKLTATQHNTLAVGDVSQARGTVTFKLPGPDGKKTTLKFDVIIATRV